MKKESASVLSVFSPSPHEALLLLGRIHFRFFSTVEGLCKLWTVDYSAHNPASVYGYVTVDEYSWVIEYLLDSA